MPKFQRYFQSKEEQDESNPKVKTENTLKFKPFKKTKGKDVQVYKVNEKRAKVVARYKELQRDKRKAEYLKKNQQLRDRAPIPKELLEKHSRGEGLNSGRIKHGLHQKRLENKEQNVKFAHELAARSEILLTEDPGFLEADAGETTTQFTQKQIVESVDITAASKHFELQLHDFGPYRLRYTRNGRHLLLGGRKGHVAALDWVTKKLHCEMNVLESVHDVCWLHIETMFAVAQKSWVYIYDHQGTELHCLKKLNRVLRMEFLPYHFLLATSNEAGYLSWLDISIGEIVAHYNTRMGRLNTLVQNPYNAVLCVGNSKGVVSMWAPKCRDPLAKMLCHKGPITALHVDPQGYYMATGSTDHRLKIWDVRKLEGPVQDYYLRATPNNVSFSQKRLLAVSMSNIVEVYRDCCTKSASKPYLRHCFNFPTENMGFCPYEDVLGVSTTKGFTSLLVPGAGEANFDAYEANPFQTKSQRKEAEVKALLEKIQPDLITLDPNRIAEVDVTTLQDKIEIKKKLIHLKAPKIDYQPRNKAKGKGGAAKIARNKKIVQETAKKQHIQKMKDIQMIEEQDKVEEKQEEKPTHVLDRFLTKKKK